MQNRSLVLYPRKNQGCPSDESQQTAETVTKSAGALTYLSERLKDYEGRADIAILSKDARATLNAEACRDFLYKCVGKPYDTRGAILAALGQWFRIPGKEREDSLFCSELADASHRAGGLCIGEDRTPTPEEMARRPIIDSFWRVKEAV